MVIKKAKRGSKKTSTKKATKHGGQHRRQVRVRMYKQGLGDCFLLTFPGESKPFHMLVDCGALKSKHYGDPEMNAAVKNIQQTLLNEANGSKKSPACLDVVAVT